MPNKNPDQKPIVISLDGNIGAGKSTLLEALRTAMPEVEVVLEPVGLWSSLKDADGKSLLELFYEDKRRWAYTFQNFALLSRAKALAETLGKTKKTVIITERSPLTDRYVFAEMLRSSGDLTELEWTLYLRWYDSFTKNIPITGILYLGTDVARSADYIIRRGRAGEEAMSLDYLRLLDLQHRIWLDATDLPVLRINVAEGGEPPLAVIQEFIGSLNKHRNGPCASVVCDLCHPEEANVTLSDEGMPIQTGPRRRR
jgi:deoxyadenosine/deoxycytidine kinase